MKVQELQLLQSESRSLGHEVEKLRSTTKELELLKEEKETLWRQFSDLSSEMTIEKENVQSLEKDKSSLESKLKDLAEKGTRYLFFSRNITHKIWLCTFKFPHNGKLKMSSSKKWNKTVARSDAIGGFYCTLSVNFTTAILKRL